MQKSIVITGSSSGIGLVAANDLLRRGYHVIA
ncbi:MAG TPA: short-chain dehydrogenase, partial [Erwinia persicina]|nr:short-chain dehydrogenase [Erwinia persicina]